MNRKGIQLARDAKSMETLRWGYRNEDKSMVVS